MKVIVTKIYNDKELKRLMKVNEEITVTKKRAETLIKAGVAVAITETEGE